MEGLRSSGVPMIPMPIVFSDRLNAPMEMIACRMKAWSWPAWSTSWCHTDRLERDNWGATSSQYSRKQLNSSWLLKTWITGSFFGVAFAASTLSVYSHFGCPWFIHTSDEIMSGIRPRHRVSGCQRREPKPCPSNSYEHLGGANDFYNQSERNVHFGMMAFFSEWFPFPLSYPSQ